MYHLEKRKERKIELSSTEEEYMALSEATQEAIWLKGFMWEIGEIAKEEAVKIYEDYQGVIALVKSPEFHKHSKQIDYRYHFVHEKVKDAQWCWNFVQTRHASW